MSIYGFVGCEKYENKGQNNTNNNMYILQQVKVKLTSSEINRILNSVELDSLGVC